eukprot:scpid52093/ scgid24033/ Glucuronokinase 1
MSSETGERSRTLRSPSASGDSKSIATGPRHLVCVILVAGHGTILETDIKNDCSGKYRDMQGVPKALLPGVGGKSILDFWWSAINTRQIFSEVFLVTNANKYKHYERWATANEFPVENIINDGSTTHQTRLGSVGDFELALRTRHINGDVMVLAGDMLFNYNFDILQVIKYFRAKGGDLAIYYEMDDSESISTRGILELDTTHRITKFWEKPEAGETMSRLASVVFYCFRQHSLELLDHYLEEFPDVNERVFGKFMRWLVSRESVYGMKLPGGFQLIGQDVGLSDYEKWVAVYSGANPDELRRLTRPITKRSYARIGLVGNPSDGFHGKTISMSIANFWADVTIKASDKLILVPHPLNDPTEFGSLADLHGISRKEGYLGGLRLLQATCKKFYQYCSERGIALAKRNFRLEYDTNIPRQVGLAGSSAIVVATLRCLMEFFNLSDADMPQEIQPNFVLSVELEELFITAGLQDRVIQIYEGLVYMDFSRDIMAKLHHGTYVNLPMKSIPQFWLAYQNDPSDSGKIHSDVKLRWDKNDEDVLLAMQQFAAFTDDAREAIVNADWSQVAKIMDKNFSLRRKVYGDAALGTANLHMIEIAKRHGSAVKFPGSGGAVFGLCPSQESMDSLRIELQLEGYVFSPVVPYIPDKEPRTQQRLASQSSLACSSHPGETGNGNGSHRRPSSATSRDEQFLSTCDCEARRSASPTGHS